jgi:hypothetical protein
VPIIAPFWGDVDTRPATSGAVTYGSGVWNGNQVFVATWKGVGYYDRHTDKLNCFQLILTERASTGLGNFDIEFRYAGIEWETGDASGGTSGYGPTSARAGWAANSGLCVELPGSGAPGSFLDNSFAPGLIHNQVNTGVPGCYRWGIRDCDVVTRPRVRVQPGAGGVIEISWPQESGAANVVLTSTDNLGVAWMPVLLLPSIENGRYVVRLSASGARRFFRLEMR